MYNLNYFPMKKEKNQEELQSRRDFFKKVAKSVLPILGGIVVSNLTTNNANATNAETEEPEIEMGSEWDSSGGSKGTCGRV